MDETQVADSNIVTIWKPIQGETATIRIGQNIESECYYIIEVVDQYSSTCIFVINSNNRIFPWLVDTLSVNKGSIKEKFRVSKNFERDHAKAMLLLND
jgi:hypothetical protein